MERNLSAVIAVVVFVVEFIAVVRGGFAVDPKGNFKTNSDTSNSKTSSRRKGKEMEGV